MKKSLHTSKVSHPFERSYNAKPPKIGGGLGISSPKNIAKALGVSVGMPVHEGAVKQLLSHPDKSIVSTAKKLLKKF